jgi:ArsR family transcriptional regulator
MLAWTSSQPLPSRVSTRLSQVRARRQRTGGFFGRIAHHWDTLRADCFGRAFQYEAFAALLPSEWVVVDVGTGTGSLLPSLSATFSRVIGVDSVAQMVTAAGERVRQLELANVSLVEGSATRLPVRSASVDLVIASLLLHHEEVPAAALREFHRVLVPGGRLLVIEQAAHELQAFHELMQDRWWGFEPDELFAEARGAGFGSLVRRRLASAEAENTSAPEAPELFVLVARK